MTKKALIAALLLPITGLFASDKLHIDLTRPKITGGVLRTDEGGIIWDSEMRIQARQILYTSQQRKGVKIHRVLARGELTLIRGNKIFRGDELAYDFITKKGRITNGKTGYGIWFAGGEKIILEPDGGCRIENAHITTTESPPNYWEMRAKSVDLSKDGAVTARKTALKLGGVPIFYLPKFHTNLKNFSDPPVRYSLVFDRGLKPRASMRYRVYSGSELDLFLRLDYRLLGGLGGAAESRYESLDKRKLFITENYLSKARNWPDEPRSLLYRLKGDFKGKSASEKTLFNLSYDYLSNERMIGDFSGGDFETAPRTPTFAGLCHSENWGGFSTRVMPRINKFQSLKQELPSATLFISPKPALPLIHEHRFKAAYLDYLFASDFAKILPDFHSSRFEYSGSAYYPLHFYGITLTPETTLRTIYYTDSPKQQPLLQGAAGYGALLKIPLQARYGSALHRLTPYIHFQGVTSPFASRDEQFIFSLSDSVAKQQNLKLGVKNALAYRGSQIVLNLYTTALFYQETYNRLFPRAYAELAISKETLSLEGIAVWNLQMRLIDEFNIALKTSLSENIALSTEYRHRSPFAARKCDSDNPLLDLTISLEELLLSPLSDKRDTILAAASFRLNPRTQMVLQGTHGMNRKGEPNYTLFKAEMSRYLTSHWLLKLGYQHSPNDDRIFFTIKLKT